MTVSHIKFASSLSISELNVLVGPLSGFIARGLKGGSTWLSLVEGLDSFGSNAGDGFVLYSSTFCTEVSTFGYDKGIPGMKTATRLFEPSS